MGRNLTEAALLAEMLALWGTRKTAAMLGWATMAMMWGVKDRKGWLTLPFSEASNYRTLAQFRELASHLVAKGYELDDAADVAPVVAAVQSASRW